jgi:cell division protein FtsL
MSIVWTARNPNSNLLKRTTQSQISLGPLSIKLLSILVIALLSIFYLFQSNASAAKSYMVSDLQKKQEDLSAENGNLQYEAERLKSLQQTEESAQERGMTQVESMDAMAN